MLLASDVVSQVGSSQSNQREERERAIERQRGSGNERQIKIKKTKWIWGLDLVSQAANKSTPQRENTLHTPPKYQTTFSLPSPPLCCAYSYELC